MSWYYPETRPRRVPLTTPVRPAGGGTVGPPGPEGPAGPAGPPGAPGAPGVGVPLNGATGTVLTKASATDYDTVWSPAAGGVTISATAPASPSVGQCWWRTTDGNLYVYYNDGTSAQWVPAMASVGKLTAGQYYLVAGALAGVPTASLSLGFYVAALPFMLQAGLAGSQAVAKTAATGTASFDVRVNGTSKGSLNWGAGATVATFTWAADVAVAAGDRIELVAPATPDATLSDPTWTLRGVL